MSNTPHVQALSTDLSVTAQLEPADMAWAASHGFRSVINNRPDFEGGDDQPRSADVEAAAHAAGLGYVHLPVSPIMQTPQQISQFASLLSELPKPILAFCRSGTRSTNLYRATLRPVGD
jgi:uncharacterized protein (TIGR01244 family)